MKLFSELPTVLPFYTDKRNQNRFKENVAKNCPFKLLSPSNRPLPFVLQIPKGSPPPQSVMIYNCDDSVHYDLSENINKLKAVDFDDFAYCYNNGQVSWTYGGQKMNFQGMFYLLIQINGVAYFSETFCMTTEIGSNQFDSPFFADNLVKIKFSDTTDIEPIRYRNGFVQEIYLDTFIHTSEPEIEEETEADGLGNKNTTFSKLTIKQKIEIFVPDFIKNALSTLPMHEDVFVYEQNKREGKIDRIKVTPSSDETGAFSTVEIVLETDILTKTQCDENKQATNANLWG